MPPSGNETRRSSPMRVYEIGSLTNYGNSGVFLGKTNAKRENGDPAGSLSSLLGGFSGRFGGYEATVWGDGYAGCRRRWLAAGLGLLNVRCGGERGDAGVVVAAALGVECPRCGQFLLQFPQPVPGRP